MKNEVKTIDIQAKEWFDKTYGNSYFAGEVTINYGIEGQRSYIMPFQYGYGDSYKNRAMQVLEENGEIDTDREYILRDRGIVIRANIERKCKQRELKQYK